jgi:hypothetical protein
MKQQNIKANGIMKWPRVPEIRMSTPEAAILRHCTIPSPSDKFTSFLQSRLRHPSSTSSCLPALRLVIQGKPILTNSKETVLPENPTVAALLRKSPTFYEASRFYAVFISATTGPYPEQTQSDSHTILSSSQASPGLPTGSVHQISLWKPCCLHTPPT